jgi:multimeric flavodoxin WrbA
MGDNGMTKVVVVSGSPKREKGHTERILKPFLEGMKDAGAEIDLVYAKRLRIRPCGGTLHCWNKTPGKCAIKDDMQSVYPILKGADILVLATPVYVPLPGEMQNFLNRLVPLMEPTLKKRNGRTRARFRSDVRIKKIVLVATSGWWEQGNLETVLRVARELANDFSVEFAGALLRPHSQLLEKGGPKVDRVLRAARESGRELISTGRISKRLCEEVGKPLISEAEWWRLETASS